MAESSTDTHLYRIAPDGELSRITFPSLGGLADLIGGGTCADGGLMLVGEIGGNGIDGTEAWIMRTDIDGLLGGACAEASDEPSLPSAVETPLSTAPLVVTHEEMDTEVETIDLAFTSYAPTVNDRCTSDP